MKVNAGESKVIAFERNLVTLEFQRLGRNERELRISVPVKQAD